MDLNEVRVFTKVVEAGSFRKAAQELRMPASTVSAKVASLERRLGVTLLRRTTRKLHLLPAGKAFFERCLEGLAALEAAEKEAASEQHEAQGELRLTAPVELGSLVFQDLIARFRKLHPKVKLQLLLSDQSLDLLGEGIDAALRVGPLRDSSLVARKIGSVYFAAVASPGYLKKAPALKEPQDLRSHEILQFDPLMTQAWDLRKGTTKLSLKLASAVTANDLGALKGLALRGTGVALLPNFMCSAELEGGRLQRVLPQWVAYPRSIYLVHPAQKFLSQALRAFLELAFEQLPPMLDKHG